MLTEVFKRTPHRWCFHEIEIYLQERFEYEIVNPLVPGVTKKVTHT